MSTTTIRYTFKVGGIATDPDSIVFCDSANAYGVKRADNGVSVVAKNTALTKEETGEYYHTFTDPAPGLTYRFAITAVYDGETYRYTGTKVGNRDSGDIYTLLPDVQLYVPGAPSAAIYKMLRDALEDFCKHSEAWVEEVDETTVEDQEEYTFTPSGDGAIARVAWVKEEDVEVRYSVLVDGTVKLDTASGEDNLTLTARLILKPYKTTHEVPEWFLERFRTTLVHGAVAKLRLLPQFAEEKSLLVHQGLFEQGINRAKGYGFTGMSGAVQTVRRRPFV